MRLFLIVPFLARVCSDTHLVETIRARLAPVEGIASAKALDPGLSRADAEAIRARAQADLAKAAQRGTSQPTQGASSSLLSGARRPTLSQSVATLRSSTIDGASSSAPPAGRAHRESLVPTRVPTIQSISEAVGWSEAPPQRTSAPVWKGPAGTHGVHAPRMQSPRSYLLCDAPPAGYGGPHEWVRPPIYLLGVDLKHDVDGREPPPPPVPPTSDEGAAGEPGIYFGARTQLPESAVRMAPRRQSTATAPRKPRGPLRSSILELHPEDAAEAEAAEGAHAAEAAAVARAEAQGLAASGGGSSYVDQLANVHGERVSHAPHTREERIQTQRRSLMAASGAAGGMTGGGAFGGAAARVGQLGTIEHDLSEDEMSRRDEDGQDSNSRNGSAQRHARGAGGAETTGRPKGAVVEIATLEPTHSAKAAACVASATDDDPLSDGLNPFGAAPTPPLSSSGSSKAVLDRPRMLSADLGGPLPEGTTLLDLAAAESSGATNSGLIGDRHSGEVGGEDGSAAGEAGEASTDADAPSAAPSASPEKEARRAARLERLAERTATIRSDAVDVADDASAADALTGSHPEGVSSGSAGGSSAGVGPSATEIELRAQLEAMQAQMAAEVERTKRMSMAAGMNQSDAKHRQELEEMRAKLAMEQARSNAAEERAQAEEANALENARNLTLIAEEAAKEKQAAAEAYDKMLQSAEGTAALMKELEALRQANKLAEANRGRRDSVDVDAMKRELEERRKENASLLGSISENGNANSRDMDASMLENELEKLRAENRRLKLEKGGELDADDDAALYETFLDKLNTLISVRNSGDAMPAGLHDEYQEALVRLSDDHMREMYAPPLPLPIAPPVAPS